MWLVDELRSTAWTVAALFSLRSENPGIECLNDAPLFWVRPLPSKHLSVMAVAGLPPKGGILWM
jgi:hypothetical protein